MWPAQQPLLSLTNDRYPFVLCDHRGVKNNSKVDNPSIHQVLNSEPLSLEAKGFTTLAG